MHDFADLRLEDACRGLDGLAAGEPPAESDDLLVPLVAGPGAEDVADDPADKQRQLHRYTLTRRPVARLG